MSTVGFKSAQIRVLDGNPTPTEGTNLFTIDGKTDKGATKTASISGLSSEPTKIWGSNVPYYVNRKGVGDVKVELSAIDLPNKASNVILGREIKNGLALGGTNTNAPLCTLTLFSDDIRGQEVAIGFFSGVFSLDSLEMATTEGNGGEPNEDKVVFTAQASDKEAYAGNYYAIADTKEAITTLKGAMGLTPGA